MLGLEIADLVTLMNERREFLTELTPEQEDALLADPKLLLMMYLLVNGWPLAAITSTFAIDDAEVERLLIRLHRARIIELLPFNRVKLLTARNFTWRKDGPVQRFFVREVQREFLDSSFAAPGEHLRFVAGLLSRTSLAQLQQVDRPVGARVRRGSRGATRPCPPGSGRAAAPSSRCGRGSSRCSRHLRRKQPGAAAPQSR